MNFHALTDFSRPGLHIWRPFTNVRRYVAPVSDEPDTNGWYRFECELDASIDADVHFKLYQRNDDNSPSRQWEDHNHALSRGDQGQIPPQAWFVQGSTRVLTDDPMAQQSKRVRIHLITAQRYRKGKLFIWSPDQGGGKRLASQGKDEFGPFWDVDLTDRDRHLFNFKFLRQVDGNDRFEPDFANRVYSSSDGPEIWTHSEGLELLANKPREKKLTVHFKHQGETTQPQDMRLWQEASDFGTDVSGVAGTGGWNRYECSLYTGIPYRFMFHDDALPEPLRWEDDEAIRTVLFDDDHKVWTLEGDRYLFSSEPKPDRRVTVRISHRSPASNLSDELHAHVWINRARWPLHDQVDPDTGDPKKFTFKTYPHVTTSFKFGDGVQWEECSRHTIRFDDASTHLERYAVIARSPLLVEPPPLADLFQNPPFWIRRPGIYQEDGNLHFVLHAPDAARARVAGDFTNWNQNALEMRSTEGGSYWWASMPIADIEAQLPAGSGGSYHGAKYKFLLNDDRWIQDPAAGWVEESSTHGNSRLIKHSAFDWQDGGWQTPGWDYFTIYQIHPKRFTDRFAGDPPLVQAAKEIDESSGYLRDLGITAILLMPINEVGSNNSWGYDPAYFYAVERDYGGPDALKHFVDTCHRHGIAVLLDVVFNHAGSDDNVLWQVSRESYFDGDTVWGAMINFDHPQSQHFFAQNLVYFQREFHVDGFRLDHTHTIVHSHHGGGFVRDAGSGGGWEFLHSLRHALHQDADSRAILTAEHLPNEWGLTNHGGPMDSQWCDEFHDRLVDACKGHQMMPRLAGAMTLSHTHCQSWYNVTNYAESHDEVGNVNDRIANVAGFGRGLRMSKVAAAASLLSRGIPMFFMGAEVGEYRQFGFGSTDVLDLTAYEEGEHHQKVRAWWSTLCNLRRSESIKGPAKLEVRYAQDQLVTFSRGLADDFFVVLNFGGWAGWKSLAELNLPNQRYREVLNSTWPVFAVEDEDEHTNGGGSTRLHRGHWMHIPDYGAVVLERA